MDHIVITGVKPWDGRYEFDLEGRELTTREWGWIKRLTGYMPFTIDEGFAGGDPELFACFAAIALRRADKIEAREVPAIYERIIDGPFGSTITLETDTVEEGDADSPPPSSSSMNNGSSGPGSPTSSDRSEPSPSRSGTPGSATSAFIRER